MIKHNKQFGMFFVYINREKFVVMLGKYRQGIIHFPAKLFRYLNKEVFV